MHAAPVSFFRFEDCVPSLQAALRQEPLDLKKILRVAVPVRNPSERPLVPAPLDRRLVDITDGNKACRWEVESLTALFRGDKQPPVLGAYPQEYEDAFFLLDLHALEISKIFGDRRDEEMLEIYSMLRRRPEGKSLGFYHQYVAGGSTCPWHPSVGEG